MRGRKEEKPGICPASSCLLFAALLGSLFRREEDDLAVYRGSEEIITSGLTGAA